MNKLKEEMVENNSSKEKRWPGERGGQAGEAAEEPTAADQATVKPVVESETEPETEQRDEQELAKHETVLEKVAEEFKEAQADFEKSRDEILKALANPVLANQIGEEKQEIKKLLKPGIMKTVVSGMRKYLFHEEGRDPARRALAELDRRKKELEDKLDKIDLVSRVLLEKAAASPDLSYLESRKRLEIRSRARFYGKKQAELLKNVGVFRKEVHRFCADQKVLVAQKFLAPDERGEMDRYIHGLK